jgi:hypothetical protein
MAQQSLNTPEVHWRGGFGTDNDCLLWRKNLLLGIIGAHTRLSFTINYRSHQANTKNTLKFLGCLGEEPAALWEVWGNA